MLGKYAKIDRAASFSFVLTLIGLMWGGFLIQKFYPAVTDYGLQPRTLVGLIGIITSPFLHGSLSHIISNTIGLFLFGTLYTAFEGKQPVRLVVSMIIYAGILQWALGGSGNHIGMSGIVFGLYGFLLTVGLFHKNVKYIVTSVFILVFYGAYLVSLLNYDPNISFSGHIIGFITGVMISKWKDN